MKAVFCINASVIERYPRICEAALESGWEFMGHNLIQKPMHAMPNEEEAILKSVELIQKFTGAKPRGWMGPGTHRDAPYARTAGESGRGIHGRLGAGRSALPSSKPRKGRCIACRIRWRSTTWC